MKRLIFVSLAVLVLAGCASAGQQPPLNDGPAVPLPMPVEPGNGATTPTLLVAPETRDGLEALVGGVLEVNAAGCVSVGGDILIAPFGSYASDSTIVLAGWGDFELGETFSASGGLDEDVPVAEMDAEHAACVPSGEETATFVAVAPKVG